MEYNYDNGDNGQVWHSVVAKHLGVDDDLDCIGDKNGNSELFRIKSLAKVFAQCTV